MIEIFLPLSNKQAIAIVVAADAFNVEPWEMAVHVMQLKFELAPNSAED